MAGLVFLIVVILNITALFFIIKKFVRTDKFNGKKSSWSIVAKVFSVILNLALAYVVFWAVALGLWFIKTYGIITDTWKIYISEFNMGFIFLETAFFVPYGLNVLLYKFWYRKMGLSKWWTFPALIMETVAFIITVLYVLSNDYIRGWTNAEWISTPYWIHFPQLP